MKKIGKHTEKHTDKHVNLEDTLEFLSLDDEAIEAYGRKTRTAHSKKKGFHRNNTADVEEAYEDEYYNDDDGGQCTDVEDEDYEDEDYETEEDEDYEIEDDENYEDEEDEDYEVEEGYEDEDDEDYEVEEDEDYEDEEDEDYEVEEGYEDEDDEDYEVEEGYEDEDDEDYEVEEGYEDEDDEDYEVEEGYEDEDDEDYEVDEDYEDEEDEDYEDEEDSDEDGEYRGNVFERFIRLVSHMTPLDYVVAVFGCFILVAAVIVGNLYLSARATDKQVEAFAEVGTEIEGISVIGESGLIAVSDAESNRLLHMTDVEDEPGEQTEQGDGGQSYTDVIEVGINITSIKSDIKIKFVNKKTNKLIGSVPFEVEVIGDSKTYNLKDEDKDGVIYQTGINAGTYTVKAVALQGDVYSKYSLPSQEQTVKVADTMEYKKVDVEDEIKTEAEVNVAVEDTAQQNTEIESVLTDTVEWVESKKTEINPDSNYQEISISDIPDPSTISKAAGFMKFSAADTGIVTVTESGADTTTAPDDTQDSENPDETEKEPGEGDKPEGGDNQGSGDGTGEGDSNGDKTGEGDNQGENNPGDGDNQGGNNDGNTGDGNGGIPAETVHKVTITDVTKSIAKGSTGSIKGTTSLEGGTIKWTSSDAGVVTVDDDGTLKGIKAGTATITGACSDMCNGKDSAEITVTETYSALKIEGDSTIQVGKTGKVTGTTTPLGGTVTWTSSNTGVVTVESDGTLKGIAVGVADITGSCAGNVTSVWKVKVVKDVSGDTTSKLKDKNGAQIYVKAADGKYVEAVYADYYTGAKFYLKKADAVYSYTGWQTIEGFTYFFDKNGNYVTGEQVIQGAKYSFDGSGRLSSGSGVLGIDVSKWNGTIDWNAVRNSGISYAIIRCGYRGSTTGALIEDPKFRANIQGAQNAGIKVGVYFFTQAVNDVEAVEEASMVLSLIKGYNLACPVFLDVEATSGSSGRADKIGADARTAVCSAFCQTIQNSGYKAGIYANKTWLDSFINTPSLTSYKIWLAQYSAAPTYTRTRIDMWQYSSKGMVSGINGNVDMNISYMNY